MIIRKLTPLFIAVLASLGTTAAADNRLPQIPAGCGVKQVAPPPACMSIPEWKDGQLGARCFVRQPAWNGFPMHDDERPTTWHLTHIVWCPGQ